MNTESKEELNEDKIVLFASEFTLKLETLVLSSEAEQRLQFIYYYDPEWAIEIIDFLILHSEFHKYVHFSSLTRRAVGFGKNPGETKEIDSPTTINEFLLYYVCHAGVNSIYGKKLWLKVRNKNLKQVTKDESITLKKKSVILEVLKLPILKDWKQVDELKIKGVGIGAKRFVRTMFDTGVGSLEYKKCIDTSDLHFMRGLQKVYNLSKKPTPKQIKELTKSWTKNARIGTMLCVQIY